MSLNLTNKSNVQSPMSKVRYPTLTRTVRKMHQMKRIQGYYPDPGPWSFD